MTNLTYQDERAQARMEEYLDEVETALKRAGLGRPERRDVLDDLETQIAEMLGARAAAAGRNAPDLHDVLAVVAELDSPESYAEGAAAAGDSADGARGAADRVAFLAPESPGAVAAMGVSGGAAGTPAAEVKRKFSTLAILGALWAPFFFLAFFGFFYSVHDKSPAIVVVASWVFLVLGATAPFGTTILGVVAISQIRQSGGRLYGMGLAIADALYLPALISGVLIPGLMLLILRMGLSFIFTRQNAEGGTIAKGATIFILLPLVLFLWGWVMLKLYRWVRSKADAPVEA